MLLSIFYLEVSSRLTSPQRLQKPSILTLDTANDDAQPLTPNVLGYYPATPQSPFKASEPAPFNNNLPFQPFVEEAQDDSPRYVSGISKASMLSPAMMLRPALKKSRPGPIQITLSQTPARAVAKPSTESFDNDDVVASTPESPDRLIQKLLQGQGSPKAIRFLARRPSLRSNSNEVDHIRAVHFQATTEPNASSGQEAPEMESANADANYFVDEHPSEARQTIEDLWIKLGVLWIEYDTLRKVERLNIDTVKREHGRLSETVKTQVSLQLCKIETQGDHVVTAQQCYLVSRCQRLLDIIDSPEKRNRLYGEELDQIPAALKICPIMREASKQCKSWIKIPPKPKEVSRGPSKVAGVCAAVFWTSEFLDSLTDSSDEDIARLPSDLFEEVEPLVNNLCHSLRTLVRVLANYPNVMPIHWTALPYARNCQRRLDELRKRAEATKMCKKSRFLMSCVRTRQQRRKVRILDVSEDFFSAVRGTKYRRLNSMAPRGPEASKVPKLKQSESAQGMLGCNL